MRPSRCGFVVAALLICSVIGVPASVAASPAPVFAAVVEGNNHTDHLVVGRLGGTGQTILKHSDYGSINALAVSPSGGRIAFAVGIDPDEQLAVIDADGSNEVVLTHTQNVHYQSVVWSADEKTLYFGRYRVDGTGGDSVWSVAADGSGPAAAISGGGKASPASLRPGGKWLALTSARNAGRTSRCAVMRTDGSDRRTVGPHDCMLPRWRPNHSQLAVSLVTTNGIEGNVTIQLWVVSTAGGQPHDVPNTQPASTNGRAQPLAWSDDGQFIYYQHFIGSGDSFRIYRIHPNGTNKKDITPSGVAGADVFAVQSAA